LIHDALSGAQRERSVDKFLAPMTHIAHELEAVSKGSEEATQKILAAAEDIDQVADNLTAALKDEIDRGLAQDIRDRVVQIFEACNFQDLTSQRVVKVMAALKEIEAEIARALAAITPARGAPSVHGPRLESDSGHASQRDIDLMFDRA
jgi:chemotaxis protein CheZ